MSGWPMAGCLAGWTADLLDDWCFAELLNEFCIKLTESSFLKPSRFYFSAIVWRIIAESETDFSQVLTFADWSLTAPGLRDKSGVSANQPE